MTFVPRPIVTIGDGANLDAFSRLRVSDADTLFSTVQNYDTSPDMESISSGNGVAPAYVANTRMVTLQVNTGAGAGVSALQSFQYWPYQAGRSQLIAMTGVMDTAVTAATVSYGYGDADNGIFLERVGTTVQVNRRTSTSGSVVNNTVAQASWNLDKLDGTGVSGITLDLTKAFILIIDLQFLGMGRVRIGFDIGGVILYAHEFRNANSLSLPYMQTASLPIRVEVSGTALGAIAKAYFKCACVTSEGGSNLGAGYNLAVQGTVTAASGARTHILSIRPKTTFAGLTNRLLFQLDSVSVLAGSNAVYWELCVGSTFSVAPTWADVDATYSAFQAGTAGTLTAATLVIASGYASSGGGSTKTATERDMAVKFPICLDAAGAVRALGTLSLLVTGISGTSACQAAFNWREIR